VIAALERELTAWLDIDLILHAPDVSALTIGPRVIYAPMLAEGETLPADTPDLSIVELSRSPANMLLSIADPLTRFLVHYTARYWNIVSFSALPPVVAATFADP
jgi:hypothetical protein